MDDGLLEGQLAYYRARAGEYDEWFLRTGRNDRGPEWNRRWFLELERVRRELRRFGPKGRVLELACGTGLWTVELARHAAGITAVDASPEVLDINRARAARDPSRGARPLRQGRPVRLETRRGIRCGVLRLLARTCLQGASPLSGTSSGRRCGRADAPSSLTRCARKHGPKRRAPGGPQRPHDAQTTQRRAGVQDRQNLLRPRRARSAPRRHGLALLGAHDR